MTEVSKLAKTVKKLYVEVAMENALRFNDQEFANFAKYVMVSNYGSDAQRAIEWHEDNRRAFNLLKQNGTQVFVFDKDAQAAIEGTEGGMGAEEVAAFFPFDAAYIKIDNKFIDGFVALKTYTEDGIGFWPVANPNYAQKNSGGESGFRVNLGEVLPYEAMCNLTAYISAVNADINLEYEPPSLKELGNKKKKRSAARIYSVGARIGAELRKYHSYADSGERNGWTVAPHMRRAHWHRFWVGPKSGERKLVAKWLAPIFVNPNGDYSEDDVVPTMRLVPDSKL